MGKDKNNNAIIPDEKLVEDCIKGVGSAWETFYERFNHVVSYATISIINTYGFKAQKDDQEDCIHTIWLSFFDKDYDKLKKWRKECSVKNYIRVCSCNAAINYFKRKSVSERSKSTPSVLNPNPAPCNIEDDLFHAGEHEKIGYIIEKKLKNPRDRLFAKLYWLDESSYIEISEIMNIPVKNLHIIKHRIKNKIIDEYYRLF